MKENVQCALGECCEKCQVRLLFIYTLIIMFALCFFFFFSVLKSYLRGYVK